MFLSCEKSTKLLIQKDYEHIAWHQQVQLFHHYLICRGCRRFVKQHRFLKENIEKIFSENEENITSTITMSEEKKQEIADKLNNL